MFYQNVKNVLEYILRACLQLVEYFLVLGVRGNNFKICSVLAMDVWSQSSHTLLYTSGIKRKKESSQKRGRRKNQNNTTCAREVRCVTYYVLFMCSATRFLMTLARDISDPDRGPGPGRGVNILRRSSLRVLFALHKYIT